MLVYNALGCMGAIWRPGKTISRDAMPIIECSAFSQTASFEIMVLETQCMAKLIRATLNFKRAILKLQKDGQG